MGLKALSGVRIPPSPLLPPRRDRPMATAILGRHAPVAQLDRASVYGTEGQRFESSRARYRSPATAQFPSVSPVAQWRVGARVAAKWQQAASGRLLRRDSLLRVAGQESSPRSDLLVAGGRAGGRLRWAAPEEGQEGVGRLCAWRLVSSGLETVVALAVLPDDLVNPGEGWSVADGAVVASRVVVRQPVWQGLAAGG